MKEGKKGTKRREEAREGGREGRRTGKRMGERNGGSEGGRNEIRKDIHWIYHAAYSNLLYSLGRYILFWHTGADKLHWPPLRQVMFAGPLSSMFLSHEKFTITPTEELEVLTVRPVPFRVKVGQRSVQ